jgi:hypothetical protein
MWGERDVLVPARKSATVYRTSLSEAGNRDVTIVVFAGADHSVGDFDARYWKTLTAWLQARFGS